MAQTGFTPILLYSSSTSTNVPLAANLTNSINGAEIAINIADKNLFFKDSGGAVNTVPIRQSSTSSNGWLSSTDWNTFNSKAPATSGTSILYGNGSGGFSNVTIGSGVTFAGGILSATGSGGTVTSVTGTSPVISSGGTTPAISLATAYGDTLNPYASKTANYILAAPNGSAGVPTFRALVTADVTGLGTMATQNANSVAITGGTINGTTIGATVQADITGNTISAFTKFVATDYYAQSITGGNLRTSGGTSLLNWDGGGSGNVTINGGLLANPANKNVSIAPTGTGTATINPATAGTINNMVIGGTTPLAITGTTITATTFVGSGASLTGVVTSVSGTAPVVSSGGTTPAISMAAATGSVNGYLTSTDWTTFNSKAPATSGTSILYGNGSGGFSNVTIGTGLTFVGGTLASTASGGTVTSVAATVPAFLSISGSPITTSGTLAISYSGTALPVANGGTGVTTSTGSVNVVLSTSPTLTTPVVTTTLGVGGATPSASGAGISFPATQSASTDVNTLDDYEEGSWTPTQGAGLTVVGAFSSSGSYTKIGNMVYVKGLLAAATSIVANGGGEFCLGLPFTALNNSVGACANAGYTSFTGLRAISTGLYSVETQSATTSIAFSITYQV